MDCKESKLRIADSGAGVAVSALLNLPSVVRGSLVMAHGAGAGMQHPFMVETAEALCSNEISVLRYNFPYMEKGRKGVDSPVMAVKTVAVALQTAVRRGLSQPLCAGGKSYGGRMTSLAVSKGLLPEVAGLCFFGFPLHAVGKPSADRAAHLSGIHIPMLFIQGSRDNLADVNLMRALVKKLGKIATLHVVEGADHSFRVAGSPQAQAAVVSEICEVAASWIKKLG
ncbi:MAG: alpha/beta hydrolase [Chitinophagales bacterium]|nr:MAG: alpha/beta hydrolase [Chitinophagales bacterium]